MLKAIIGPVRNTRKPFGSKELMNKNVETHFTGSDFKTSIELNGLTNNLSNHFLVTGCRKHALGYGTPPSSTLKGKYKETDFHVRKKIVFKLNFLSCRLFPKTV